MRNPPPTIASEWEELRDELLKDFAPEVLPLLRMCFYAGFFGMLTIAIEVSNPKVELTTRWAALKRLFEEHDRYMQETREGHTA